MTPDPFLIFLSLILSSDITITLGVREKAIYLMRLLVRRYSASEEKFWRDLIFSEEKRRLYTTAPWSGGYRWFESPNIIPIEHYRRPTPAELEHPTARMDHVK